MAPTRSLPRRLATAALCILACSAGVDDPGSDTTGTPEGPTPAAFRLRTREVVSGLAAPVFLTAPRGDARLFVVEQGGRVRIVENGRLLPTPFLDLTTQVSAGGERGLLGMAFHPAYATNGVFFVNYTDRVGDTRVARYRVSADRDRADPASASIILTVRQPFSNHNGGMLLFGPDGKLYVPLGDGGSGGDPQGNGQNLATLLGKMLRLDVDAAAPYAVPADNPYVGRPNALPEIWASGLRNPWRVAFDPPTNRLYVADVGQGRLEEITVVGAAEAGVNYGWNVMEGSACYGATPCTRDGLRPPTVEYDHADGCSITGGYVYRGAIAEIVGHYFYSDYCRGFLRSFRLDAAGAVAERRTWDVGTLGNVSSFGVDGAGELYVLTGSGRILALERAP